MRPGQDSGGVAAPRTEILSGSMPNRAVIAAAVTVSLLSEKEAYWLIRTARSMPVLGIRTSDFAATGAVRHDSTRARDRALAHRTFLVSRALAML